MSTTGSVKLFPLFVSPQRKLAETKHSAFDAGLHTPLVASVRRAEPAAKRIRLATKPQQVQLYIDAGQKSLGRISCPDCAFFYWKGVEEDEASHDLCHRTHLAAQTGFPFRGFKDEQTVVPPCPLAGHDDRVLLVKPTSPTTHLKLLESIQKIMEKELGPVARVFGSDQKAFLYVSKGKVIGCVIAEIISTARRVMTAEQAEDRGLKLDSTTTVCSEAEERALCGISCMWVCAGSRRRNRKLHGNGGPGVATILVDCARVHLLLATVCERSQVAFSQPTSDGKRFAVAYTGTESFLAYS